MPFLSLTRRDAPGDTQDPAGALPPPLGRASRVAVVVSIRMNWLPSGSAGQVLLLQGRRAGGRCCSSAHRGQKRRPGTAALQGFAIRNAPGGPPSRRPLLFFGTSRPEAAAGDGRPPGARKSGTLLEGRRPGGRCCASAHRSQKRRPGTAALQGLAIRNAPGGPPSRRPLLRFGTSQPEAAAGDGRPPRARHLKRSWRAAGPAAAFAPFCHAIPHRGYAPPQLRNRTAPADHGFAFDRIAYRR
jgi:hypothetical protein